MTPATFSSLVEARYQNHTANAQDGPHTPTIELLLRHQSVRKFLSDALPPNALEMFVAAGQSASTSSMLQNWSLIAIQDLAHKDAVATLCGDQDFIRQAPLFLIFCTDLHRMSHLCEKYNQTGEALDKLDLFMQGTLDAAIAAQNITIAAESLGLGVCYVGAARNNAAQLAQLLRIPERCAPVFGLAVGKPDPVSNPPAIKPRLPIGEVLHRERWNDDRQDELIASYDDALGAFYFGQEKLGRKTWSDHTSRHVSTTNLDGREVYRTTLGNRGFKLD
ncbi:hypothetical protein CABS01_08328 [Colletotrichum abscissum]|uniref:Nitroreductase domain-containing protein n=2 Tax=Colletotrichum acutatum species complex TaxID=2707335 RepID=A0A9Q0AZP4_9PEZI|nr:uncharacterized protein CCOS01_15424 [Colletotrichum costaricense]XP_060401845.1 uncharacterized protein CABS01_08328 [Colletotrichum abscissum]KAI3549250.1 hypothetical protein CABS02_08078 [Colletotrichum abscissum]KAK1507148.1 hypothetical protein CABS01_08328 [Colletotrichum abscissum]KAK1509330.1 hypothetical protein CCOS01_15424 [Colletotrichum costaricense]